MIFHKYIFQERSIDFLDEMPSNDGRGVFLKMGLGKTYIALVYIYRNKHTPCLAIVPKRALEVWRIEAKRLGIKAGVVHGPDRQSQLVKHISSGKTLIITNPDSVRTLDMKGIPWQVIILDESTCIKNTNTLLFRAMAKIKGKHHVILTATPRTNSDMDVFGQYMWMDGGKTFDTNFYRFRYRFFLPSMTYPHQWTLDPRRSDEFKQAFWSKGITFSRRRISKLDGIRFPSKSSQVFHPTLTREQSRLIEQLEREFALDYGDTREEYKHTLTVQQKVRQITSGFVYNKRSGTYYLRDNPKLEMLEDIIRNILRQQEQAIVFCCYKAEVRLIRRMLNGYSISNTHAVGGMSGKAFDQNIASFNKGEKSVLVANIASTARALNIPGARYAIYYSLPWSYEKYYQSTGRIDRLDTLHQSIHYIRLIYPESIDQIIAYSLKNHHSKARYLMDVRKWIRRKNV